VLALVGESGSGKSVTGFSIVGLIDPPGRIVDGSIAFEGRDLVKASDDELRRVRGARIAMIFQDPLMTLNPVLRIGTQLVEAVLAHDPVTPAEAKARARDALGRVGIPSPEERLDAYPHEFSGGMRQRVAIAAAMLHKPALIIADEPTTALDVTVQGQIIYELRQLTRELGTSLIWITHDLSVVAGLADDIAVMYAGRIVETGGREAVLRGPRHPYTRGLIGSIPSRNRRGAALAQIPGLAPVPIDLPPDCAFRPRCTRQDATCARDPELSALGPGHLVRCWHPCDEPPP
jgi:peptide/nickel transport system ATP-binding protein